MEILFWEDINLHLEREEFRKYILTENGILTTTDKSDLDNTFIVFIHGGDSGSFPKSSRVNDGSKVFVFYGDNKSKPDKSKIDQGIIKYINFDELKFRFEIIISQIKHFNSIDADKIFNLLFDRDSEFEKIIQPFITISPFADAKDIITYMDQEGSNKEINVGDAYEAIQAYEKKNSL